MAVADLVGLVGEELGCSEWLAIPQPMIDAFADLTNDRQWIHVDVERAREAIGTTIAHGFLAVALMPQLSEATVRYTGLTRSLNYGFDSLRFTNPIPSGARVRLRERLKSAEPKGSGLLLNRHCTLELEGHERPALVAEWLTLVFG